MRALDPVLADKIKELRIGLGLLQAQFAQKLNVSPTQISEWEKGTKERPSVEKLLEMASISPSEESREWFWRKAGIDLEAIKAHFGEKVRHRTALWESGHFLRVPIVRELSLGANGELLATEEGALNLPAEEFRNPGSIICLKGTNCDPWIMRDGSRVVVDRSVTDPRRLLGRITAVHFERFPLLYGSLFSTSPEPGLIDLLFEEFLEKIDPGGYFSRDEERVRRRKLAAERAKRPGVLVGRLDIEGIERPTLHNREPKAGPWRLALFLQTPLSQIDEIIGLSKWQTTENSWADPLTPLTPLVPNNVRIIGRVIMDWFTADEDSPPIGVA
jgi:transcriptional regulator with XRE-family HTH domain